MKPEICWHKLQSETGCKICKYVLCCIKISVLEKTLMYVSTFLISKKCRWSVVTCVALWVKAMKLGIIFILGYRGDSTCQQAKLQVDLAIHVKAVRLATYCDGWRILGSSQHQCDVFCSKKSLSTQAHTFQFLTRLQLGNLVSCSVGQHFTFQLNLISAFHIVSPNLFEIFSWKAYHHTIKRFQTVVIKSAQQPINFSDYW